MTMTITTLHRISQGFSFAAIVLALVFMGANIMDGWNNDAYSRGADFLLGAGLLASGLANPRDILGAPLGLALLLIGSPWFVLDAILGVALVVWAIVTLLAVLAKRSARSAA